MINFSLLHKELKSRRLDAIYGLLGVEISLALAIACLIVNTLRPLTVYNLRKFFLTAITSAQFLPAAANRSNLPITPIASIGA